MFIKILTVWELSKTKVETNHWLFLKYPSLNVLKERSNNKIYNFDISGNFVMTTNAIAYEHLSLKKNNISWNIF